ncbi:telomerase-binding protein EST1A-like isoform X2 [Mercenaria mercenaria]|uniref:telomerase-binding protein EST1A-like isoform X2 n=1 Tax=Mercenaria mercenaria TaxID=6596 RepID=UPI00234E73E5|nr:telomerase-binding protein EST1A-like isoform X2 [Mercenaria mercenaria]
MAAESDVVRITYKELEDIAQSNEEKEEEEKIRKSKEETKKKREQERKTKRPSLGIYKPPHRSKPDKQGDHGGQKENSPEKSVSKPVETELHISEENWEEDIVSDPSSKENSVEKELAAVNAGIQDLKITAGDTQRHRRSDESRRKKKPEIQRYVPKGRLLEQQQQQQVTDASGENSGDLEDELSSPSPKTVHSPSPGPATATFLHAPQSPSPRKIDLKNMQVTVINNKSETENRISPEKNVEQPIKTGNRNARSNEQEYSKGRGQGQSYSRGRGQRHNQRSNTRQSEGRNNRGLVGNKNDAKEQRPKIESKDTRTEKLTSKQDSKVDTDNKQNKDVKADQELYIVPSRPSTIGQEADRKDTAPVGMEESNQKINENKPSIDKQEILSRFRRTPNKTKSRSYDKLNQSDRFEDDDGYYPDPQNLGTMVFERSHSSEQLNLSGRNLGKPPMPRSSSGSGTKNIPKKHAFSGMRKRTDSVSSDLSTGTGSDWSTEELDFDKELDNTSKIDWNEDVERELALQCANQVQDETQKMNEWFERQELGLSQKEGQRDRTNNAKTDIMTSSTPGYLAGFPGKSDSWSERSSTLPLPKRKQNHDEPRGRTDRRRGFRSRDSSVSSVHSVQSVQSVQSAYSGDGRRRRRRRRKSSGSQKGRSGSMEHMNISVTCGGHGNRRQVKVDNYKGRSSENLSRQNSSEGPYRRGSRDESWKGPRDETWRDRGGYRGDDRGRGGKGQHRGGGGRGRGFDKRGSYEQLDDPYYSRDRWHRDEGHSRQNERNRNYSGGRGSDNRQSHSNRDNWDDRKQSHRGRGRGYDRRDRDDHNRGQRDDKGNYDKFSRDRDYRHEDQEKPNEQPHGGGILHIPPQPKEQDTGSHPAPHRKTGPHEHHGWGRGHTPDRGGSHARERQHSGSHRQKTLFDPNNPSKPIVIEEAKPKLEFKDNDSYPSSPQSPQYMGQVPPPPPDMYGNRGYGPGPYYPPGYGYGYNMPPMMPPPPGMYDPYVYQAPPEAYRETSPYPEDPYYQSGMDIEHQMAAGRSRSHCRMMAEQLLREAIPMDKQLNHLISRRIGGEDTLHMISQLRRELQVRCEKLILLDPDLANRQNVEQMLWKSVFHHMVELIRKQLAEDHAEETRLSLNKILDEGTTFYESLLEKLQSTFNFDLGKFLDPHILSPENLSRTIKLALLSSQRTMICLGDIARYKEQNNDGGKVNYAKARSWYSKAQQIAPKNGRPYNQLAILALYTKHKLDAVYYYMRSLAASNPFITARESLMSLFNEARKKYMRMMAEVNEKLRFEERKKQEGLKKHRNVRQHRVEIWVKNDGTSSQSKVDDNYDEDLSKLDTVQLNKRFVLSFLNVHGKLFTKIGMEMFPDSCGQMLQEFKALLKDNAIGPQRLLQLMAINMFAIENTALKDESLESTCRSLLQQHSVQMGLDMFGILVERCAQLLAIHTRSDDYPGRMFSRELEELVPGIKVWTNWMICHADLWNPPPQVRDPAVGPDIDVWSCTATLCNILKEMDTSQVKFYTERSDGLEAVILSEDMMMSGFVPLLTTPLTSTFVEDSVDKDMARDCLRVEKLRVFGEYLCGVEPPMLAYSAETKKYYSVAPSDGFENDERNVDGQDQQELSEEDDVVIEDEEIVHLEDTDDQHVQHLKARKEELEKRMEEKKRLHEHRKNVIETNRHSCIEIEIRPIFLIPDTNCFIDHLPSLMKLINDRQYTLVIPLVVINELDGLAQGQRTKGQYDNEDHANKVKHRAANTIEMLEKEFEKKNSHLKALTSKGTVMETISFRSEETDSSGNNDDLILSCCTYYCKDKARDFMPKDKDTPVHLYREVVLLTDDRNLRLKAHTHNVPVKDIPAFMKWSSAT